VKEADRGWVKRLTSSETNRCHVMGQVWAGKLVSLYVASACSLCVLARTVCQTFDIEWAILLT
jgi:hypothetical protein